MHTHCADSTANGTLSPEQHDFVRLSAVMGIPTALALADASEHMGRAFSAGGADPEQFSCLTDRLHEFLEFVVLAEPILLDIDLHMATAVTDFRARLLAAVDGIQDALERCEPHALGVALGDGLAGVLGEYSAFGGNVAMAIRGVPLAA